MLKKVNHLIELEQRLDEHGRRKAGIPIGSLLIHYWRHEYKIQQGYEWNKLPALYFVFSFIKHAVKILLYKPIKADKIKNCLLILGKTAEIPHYKALIEPIQQSFSRSYEFVHGVQSAYSYQNNYEKLICILRTTRLIFFIREIIDGINPKDRWLAYLSSLLLILQYFLCINFLKKTKAKIIVVDYDRDKYIPLILAGKTLEIKTITLQHGVINPPYGYTPILADEIWVWGSLWSSLLQEMGVTEKRIRITGTPIIRSVNQWKGTRQLKLIGLGPNPISDQENQTIWLPIIEAIKKNGADVLVKLHPSQSRESNIGKWFSKQCSTLEAKEISNEKFMESIDLLIISSSGLGYETVCFGKPVMVVRHAPHSTGNDWIMIEKAGFPEVTPDNITYVINKYKHKLSELHTYELENLKKIGFEYVGNDSAAITIQNINRIIYEMD